MKQNISFSTLEKRRESPMQEYKDIITFFMIYFWHFRLFTVTYFYEKKMYV